MSETGVVVIHKEKNYTSHDVVAVVKRTLHLKAGHTGTLDPQAEGVLPVCVGSATKLAGFLAADDKAYIAKVRLGMTTGTGDDTGEILSRASVIIGGPPSGGGAGRFYFTQSAVEDAVSSFAGEQTQIPPMYSAVKVGGRKLYELARKGKVVEREPRRIMISSIKVTEFSPDGQSFTIEVSCSKGTYIRSLCADIGEKLGCGACMCGLLRTRSGIFTLAQAVKLSDLTAEHIMKPESVLPYPRAEATPEAEKLVLNGNPVPCEWITFNGSGEDGRYWLYYQRQLRGLYKINNGRLRPEVIL